MDLGLKGLRAVVTGGSKGIGRAAADIFAQEGAKRCNLRPQRGRGEGGGRRPEGERRGSLWRRHRRRRQGGAQKYIADSAAALGGIDILVANVSALAAQDVEESWSKAFEVDMMHTVHAVTAALPFLEKSKHPSIVIISSVSGREVDFAGPAYGALKAALIHYAQKLAYQHAPKMIRVNAVSPGNTYFDGGVWQNIEKNLPDLLQARAVAEPDRANGETRGDRPRHRLSRQPRLEFYDRNQSGDRRSLDQGRAALAVAEPPPTLERTGQSHESGIGTPRAGALGSRERLRGRARARKSPHICEPHSPREIFPPKVSPPAAAERARRALVLHQA